MLTTKTNRIVIWRFRAAPRELQLLHHGAPAPEWLVFVPRSIRSQDLDTMILRQGGVTRHQTLDGDLVYAGGQCVFKPFGRAESN